MHDFINDPPDEPMDEPKAERTLGEIALDNIPADILGRSVFKAEKVGRFGPQEVASMRDYLSKIFNEKELADFDSAWK